MMRERVIVMAGLWLMATTGLACNAFAGRPDSLLPAPPAVATQEGVPVDSGSEGGPAPTVTLPAEVAIPIDGPVVRILVDLNVRGGPGVQFPRVGFLLGGDTAAVLGRDANSGWWRIVCPPESSSAECWVSGGSQYTRLLAEAPSSTPEP